MESDLEPLSQGADDSILGGCWYIIRIAGVIRPRLRLRVRRVWLTRGPRGLGPPYDYLACGYGLNRFLVTFNMPNEFDPYREKLVVEATTVWPPEHDDWDVSDRLSAEVKLHAEPDRRLATGLRSPAQRILPADYGDAGGPGTDNDQAPMTNDQCQMNDQ